MHKLLLPKFNDRCRLHGVSIDPHLALPLKKVVFLILFEKRQHDVVGEC